MSNRAILITFIGVLFWEAGLILPMICLRFSCTYAGCLLGTSFAVGFGAFFLARRHLDAIAIVAATGCYIIGLLALNELIAIRDALIIGGSFFFSVIGGCCVGIDSEGSRPDRHF